MTINYEGWTRRLYDLAQVYGRKDMTDKDHESEMIDEDEDEDEVKMEAPVEVPIAVSAVEAVAAERKNIAKQLNALVSRASSANPLAEPLRSLIRKLETS